jgi:acyl-CoA synthetase (AMP-forming)/AMP-acid ligase II
VKVEREPWLGAQVLSYPDRPRTVVDVLDGAVAAFGDRMALRAPEGDLTYAEFAEVVEGAVERLTDEGLTAGDRLAVAARNGLDLAVALFACARGGFVMVGLNLRLRAPQWAYMLRHSGARLALGQPEALDELRAAGVEAGMAATAVRDVGDHFRGRRRPWAYDAGQRPDEAAAFAVVYTSGTTGRPKASRVVHRCSVHSAMSYVEVVGLAGNDRTAVLFPLYYISGLHAHVLPMMLVGGTSVLVADASAHDFVELLARERITWMYTVPSMWQLLLREDGFTASALPDLRRGAFGGSPFPTTLLDSIRQRFPRVRLTDIYGLSETHSPATMLRDEEFTAKRGSVGRPLPCMEAKVVDDSGHEVPAGDPGELLLRGSLVTTGYDGDDEATRAAISAGWLRTGDLARMDPDGYVFILDRKKDMITRGGNKIFSVEVEQLLLTHPAIADAAVVGIPDPIAFEAVAAYVVPTDGAQLTRRDVQRWVAERMSDYAVPRQVRVVDEIPRNRTGKILKADLRQRLLDELGPLSR